MKRPLSLRSIGFTLLELLTVITIIVVLAGLILSGAGFAQQKAARDRASAEIAALSVALESYRSDNGEYPRDQWTDGLAAGVTTGTAAKNANQVLYRELSGAVAGTKRYFEFKSDMVVASNIMDPFGNPYGYSTLFPATSGSSGFNPTFDLWSTGGGGADQTKWIKNW